MNSSERPSYIRQSSASQLRGLDKCSKVRNDGGKIINSIAQKLMSEVKSVLRTGIIE
jgi:hypothetical protein